MTSQTTNGQGKDGGENGGFEEENDGEHGDASFTVDAHGRGDEDHNHGHEEHENPAGLHDHHGSGCGESSNGEETLADGIAIRGISVAEVRALDCIFDELRSNADLGANVTELSRHAKEEFVLLTHGLVDVSGQAGALLGLERHIGVGDFGNGGEEEDDGEQEDESGDAKVGPLDVGEVFGLGVFEEDARSEEGCHDGANGLERLGKLETEFRQSGRTTGGDERIGRGFEGGETGADDEEGAAEAAEGSIDGRRPEHQGSDTVDTEAGDEGPSVAESADNPAGVGEGTDEIGAEVSTLQTTSLGRGDVEGVLELGVEDVEEAVGKAPEEEEDGDEGDGEDGLFDGQGGGTCDASVGDAPLAGFGKSFDSGRSALVEDVFDLWFFVTSEHRGG